MTIFNFFRSNDINEKLEDYNKETDAILLDVRRPEEYKDGHIPKAINIPLEKLEDRDFVLDDKPIYLYCRSGVRSAKSKELLESYGYKNIKDIGGIIDYKGQLEY